MNKKYSVIDGNESAAYVAHRTNEIGIIYPITPATTMGELFDQWSAENIKNIWGTVPHVVEMQSEAGAAGAIHGALQTGALATTFTSSQGLLLMIPNMYRIASELTPAVFHVATRILAYQGMSIYCDHSDVYAARSTGFAMLSASTVQEAHDFALISQAASLKSRIPFLHFFDGLRTSHEINKIEMIKDEEMLKMLDEELIIAARNRKLSPENPSMRDVVQNHDIVFQARESSSKFYDALPNILDDYMRRFEKLTGRSYQLLRYFGPKDAERIIVIMGSGASTVEETVSYLEETGEKVAVITVHLFRPFPKKEFLKILPQSCKAIAILDRVKESGASAEPLCQEVSTTLLEAYSSGTLSIKALPKTIAGRFGIGSKEFTPGMVKSIFDELKKDRPKNNFTIGIQDDLMHTSLSYSDNLDIEGKDVIRAIFFGLGSDGTIGANKNTIKIIGEETDQYVQGYFVFDGKKSGSKTISHLRFSKKPIKSTYLIQSANFVACHNMSFIDQFNVLENAGPNSIFLLNSNENHEKVWETLPRIIQEEIIAKNIQFYVIDANKVAAKNAMQNRINTIMQTCFFALSNVLPKDVAIAKIKNAIKKTYRKKGEAIIQQNYAAVDATLANLFLVKRKENVNTKKELISNVHPKVPNAMRGILDKMLADRGHELPVSAIHEDGAYYISDACWEKRDIATEISSWNPELCIQCGQCSLACPHSVIRAKHLTEKHLANAPENFKTAKARDKNFPEHHYALQIHAGDCLGCGICVEACPAKSKTNQQEKAINMMPKPKSLAEEANHANFFLDLPNQDMSLENINTARDTQHLPTFFEFNAACAGCGEAPYVKLLSQLYGDRLLAAFACGCSYVFACNLPTMPWTKDKHGRGPATSGSLFEDNAEFGFGFALTADKQREQALELLEICKNELGEDLVTAIKKEALENNTDIAKQRARIAEIKNKLLISEHPRAQYLLSLLDYLIRPSIWAIGGDGWAYDIGYNGLDHVLASGRNINILVLDTEVYSNTGGQSSKATPRGSVAKFAAEGKKTAKKDLGLIAITYGNIYVASIALGANSSQAIKAFKEAESYPGPSLIIAYSHCIAHGIDMNQGLRQQKLAVKSGYWPLYRYNPMRKDAGLNPMQLDSEESNLPLQDYIYNENRFKILLRQNPEAAEKMLLQAEDDVKRRWHLYKLLAK